MIEPYIGITTISYGITEVIKRAKIVPDEVLPLISLLVSILCAIVVIVYKIDIGASNFIDLFAVAISSGLSAIGLNQLPKQIKKATGGSKK